MATRKSNNRLYGYDYSQSNYYYVTICAKDRKSWFGQIYNDIQKLNDNGKIVEQQWNWLNERYSYVNLDKYIVMPNHFHGILNINNSDRTGHDLSLHKIKSLSSLIGVFKTTSSKKIHQAGHSEFFWQRSFYDHVIRDENELNKIREYIQNNPAKWPEDEENPNVI